MPRVATNITIRVPDGPSLSIQGNYDVEVIDTGDVLVPKGGQEVTINIMPQHWDQAVIVVIQSSQYDTSNLTYTIGTAANTQNVPLDRPVSIIGRPARLLGPEPGTLKVKNNTNSDVTIKVLVGRNASST